MHARSVLTAVIACLCMSTATEGNIHRRRHKSADRYYEDLKDLQEKTWTGPSPKDKPYQFGARIPGSRPFSKGFVIEEHEQYNEVKPVSCLAVDCPAGHVCMLDSLGQSSCICGPDDLCETAERAVCGSDGIRYGSHCELHRIACHERRTIRVDPSGQACIQNFLDSSSMIDTNHVVSKKKDLSFIEEPKFNSKTAAAPSTVAETLLVKGENSCSKEHLAEFCQLLFLFHCDRLDIDSCVNHTLDTPQRSKLVSVMFSYYDRNADGFLDESELSHAQTADHLEKLAHTCTLNDLIISDSASSTKEHRLEKDSFLLLFNITRNDKKSMVTTATVDTTPIPLNNRSDGVRELKVVSDGVRGVALSCKLAATQRLLWLRNGKLINVTETAGLTRMDSNTLFISVVTLVHTGTYSCYDTRYPELKDTILLIVQTKPVVTLKPVGLLKESEATRLQCHGHGVPSPVMSWQIDQFGLPADTSRYDWLNDNSTVLILSPNPKKDSGKYQCVALSEAGWAVAATEVVVLAKEDKRFQDERKPQSHFVVFHGNGYTSYETEHCFTTHLVDKSSSDFTESLTDPTSTLSTLCPPEGTCQWGSAINVKHAFIYATQPKLNRVVVIDIVHNLRPRKVLLMVDSPVTLHYLPVRDELLLLVGQREFQRLMVVADASSDTLPTAAPLLTFESVFDSVSAVFVPSYSVLGVSSRYIYTTRFHQQGLNRVDTVGYSPKGGISLADWNCSPEGMIYLAIGGLAVVSCKSPAESFVWQSSSLLLDVLTNSVLQRLDQGLVYASPDSRHLVFLKDSDYIVVRELLDNGTLVYLYDQVLQIDVSHITFMPSKLNHGYDLVFLSPDENSVLFMNIKTRETELIGGLLSGRTNTSPTPGVIPLVSASGEFGEHLMVPSQGAVFVVNKQYHYLACEWTNLPNATLSIWITA